MKSLFSVFKKGLKKTSVSISRSLHSTFRDIALWKEENYEELEDALISADFGVEASMKIVDNLRDRYKSGEIKTGEDMLVSAHNDICFILEKNMREIAFSQKNPTIIVLAGVNGSGKTTTAGKLAALWSAEGKKVMLAACDTFRAAAVEQLKLWGDKTSCHVISARQGADPSAVAYDAVQSAMSRGADVLLIDTAGRQHTSKGLMDELSKMRRTVNKLIPGAPDEIWLTVDSSTGTNAMVQAKEFLKAVSISGLVITKLDGTGKGGIAVAIQDKFDLPIFFTGFGEQPEDLQPFNPVFYSRALFGEENISSRMSGDTDIK
jgi:fused signal recognition particle receptor